MIFPIFARAFILIVEPFPSTLISAPLLVSLTCKAFLPAFVGAGLVVPIPTLPSFAICNLTLDPLVCKLYVPGEELALPA